MNKRTQLIIVAVMATIFAGKTAPAEDSWPSLPDYVRKCVVIIMARTAVTDGKRCEFEITEVWKGTTDILPLNDHQRYVEWQGTHGIKVTNGQDIVFFFTRHNQPPTGKVRGHSTSFPVSKGKIVYASSSESSLTEEMTIADFKKRILETTGEEKNESPNQALEAIGDPGSPQPQR